MCSRRVAIQLHLYLIPFVCWTYRLRRLSAVDNSDASFKRFDSQSGRGSSALLRRSNVSVAAATADSQQRPQKGSGHGATMVTGHAGPQEASPRDETSCSTSPRWAMSTRTLVVLLSPSNSHIHSDRPIRGDRCRKGGGGAISLSLRCWKVF